MNLPYIDLSTEYTFTPRQVQEMRRELLSTLLMHAEGEYTSATTALIANPGDTYAAQRQQFWDKARNRYDQELTRLDELLEGDQSQEAAN